MGNPGIIDIYLDGSRRDGRYDPEKDMCVSELELAHVQEILMHYKL